MTHYLPGRRYTSAASPTRYPIRSHTKSDRSDSGAMKLPGEVRITAQVCEDACMKKVFLSIVLLSAVSAVAAGKQLLNLGSDGVAIQGYDPVAFFTQHKPVKGVSQFQSAYNGAKYLFASAEDKAAFDKEPGKYEPQFGGYCAYGVSHGSRAPIKIEAWQIVNGRLLMQYDLDVKDSFNKDQQGTLKKADQNWPGLVDKYGK